jgi:hypothetical protein
MNKTIMNPIDKKKIVGMLILLATAFIMAALAGCDGSTPAMKISEEGSAGTSGNGGFSGSAALGGSTGNSTGGTVDPGTAGVGGENGTGAAGTGGEGGGASAGATGTGGEGGVSATGSGGTTPQNDGGADTGTDPDAGTMKSNSDGSTTDATPPRLTCEYEGNGLWSCPAAAAGHGTCTGSDGDGGTACCLTCTVGKYVYPYGYQISSCGAGLTDDSCGAGGQECSPCGTGKHCEPFPSDSGIYGGTCRVNTP